MYMYVHLRPVLRFAKQNVILHMYLLNQLQHHRKQSPFSLC